MSRLIEIGKMLRKYDLKTIRTQELEQLTLTLHNLKTDWSELKASMQEKVKFVQEVQTRHKKEVLSFESFCDYLEPKSFNEKLRLQIRQIHTQETLLTQPVSELEKTKRWLET